MPPQWFLLRVRVILFLLLNKQKIITYNTVESPSAVISMMSWVTEYLSMKKYHEGSPTLKVHSCSLTIRLLPCHLLVSIFIFHLLCTFTSAHTSLPTTYVLLTCTWMSMWGVIELKESFCESTISLCMYCIKSWDHEKMYKHLNNTEPIIFHTQKSPSYEPVLCDMLLWKPSEIYPL